MKDERKTKKQLIAELAELRQRVAGLEAARADEVLREKPLRDLIEIIHFTEDVAAKIHGLLDEAEIYEAVRKEFSRSRRHAASIELLTEDGSRLRIAQASIPSRKLRAGEKASGLRLKGFQIDLKKSSIFRRVVREGETVQADVSDIIGEFLPRRLANLISHTMGYEGRPSILTPLERHGEIIGVFAMSSTGLAEHLVPSVRSLARHISTALELASEYTERGQAEEALRKARDELERQVGDRTAELRRTNEELRAEIAERKRTEEALRASEERYRAIFEQAADSIVLIDAETGALLEFNDRAHENLGYTREEFEKLKLADFEATESAEEIAKHTERIINKGMGIFETKHRTKDGELRDVLVGTRAISVRGEHCVQAIWRDITERKRAEEILRAEKEKAQQYLDVSGVALIAFDREGRVTMINRRGLEMLGYREEELVGRSWVETCLPERMRDEVAEVFRRIVAGDVEPVRYRENPVLTKDGQERMIAWHNAVLRDAAGEIVGILSSGEDVTERRRAEEALALRAEQLVALSQASQTLTASLDLNQVLAEIVSLAGQVVASDYTSVVLVDEAGNMGQTAENLPGVPALRYRVRREGLTDWIVRTRCPAIIDEIGEDGALIPGLGEGAPRLANPPIAEAGVKSLAGLPLMAKERLLGVLYLHSLRPQAFSDQLPLLTAFASQTAIAIENARLYESVQRELVERVRADEALRASEERYRTLFEGLPVGLYRRAQGGEILDANPALVEMLGYPDRESLLAVNANELDMDPEERGQQQELLEREGVVRGFEARLRRHDGTIIWARDTARVVRDADGRMLFCEGSLEDVTERRRAAEALRRHAERLRTLRAIDGAILAAWSPLQIAQVALRRIRNLVPCVAASVILFDFEAQEAVVLAVDGEIKTGSGTRLPIEGLGEIEALRQGRVLMEEDLMARPELPPALQALRAAGVHSYLAVPLIAQGELIGVLGLVTTEGVAHMPPEHVDIASEVGNEVAVALHQTRLRAALESEHNRLETLVEHLPEGILLLDSERRILLANPAAESYLAVLTGTPETTVSRVGETLTHLGPWAVAELVQSLPEGLWREIELAGPPHRIFGVAAQPMRGEPQTEGWVLMVWDLTHEREVERQIRQQERMAAVGRLAGGIAHDFNNFLTTILLYAQMVLRKPNLPPDLAPSIQTILDEAQGATGLVQQILDFSRRSMMQAHPVNLISFVEEAVAILRRTLPENIRLLIEVGAEGCVVNADPTRIQQVVMNLATNARDAMPEGGELRIALSRLQIGPQERPPLADMSPGDWVCLAVSDTGIGMTEETQSHLFEPFFTTKEPGEGTGLGLAQVYGIVRQHEGYIGVETEVGEGTTFLVYLPAHGGEGDGELTVEEARALPKGKGEIILLVEDEEKVREAGQEVLESLGYRVLTAANGQQALDVYRSAERVDLLITDVVMPEMGGRQLVQALREVNPQVRALAITGYSLADDLQKLEEAGIRDVIQKPLDVGALAQAIRQVLDED